MTPIELAAVASAAVPGLNLTACAAEPDDAADFNSALLVDVDSRRWRVRSPKHAEASTRLETELQVLRAFAPAIRAELPFLLPTVAGTVRQGDLTTFVYSHIAGTSRPVEDLAAGGAPLAMEIGAAIAAIHDLPQTLVTNSDLPSYTSNEFRQRKLNELDQAATTGKIPASLLRRWEHALEDVALWRFSSCVVHGDLHEDNILLDGNRVTAVIGWTDLRVGDPADDFAWLVAINDAAFVQTVQEAYSAARKETPDPHLLRRAALSAEFALAQWLVKGVAADNARMVADAEDMLRTLEHDINTHGGQPISTEPAPATVAVEPVAAATDAGKVPAVTVSEVPKDESVPDAKPADAAAVAVADAATDDTGKPDDVADAPAAAAEAESAATAKEAAEDAAEPETPANDAASDSASNDDSADERTARTAKHVVADTAESAEDVDTTAMKIIPLKK
jgi:macrolide phosphotransferase